MIYGTQRKHIDKIVIYLFGEPATGKTAGAMQMCRDLKISPDKIFIKSDMSKWWDGLLPSHEAVILEDISGFEWGRSLN